MNFFLLLLFFLAGCSGLEKSEQEKLRRHNAKGEFVYRKHDDVLFAIPTPAKKERDKYPWEEVTVGSISRITKEFFRCKGAGSNPPRVEKDQNYFDCGSRHSLPMRGNKEFVYPVLVDLLNYIQQKTQKKVIVTCGYRCPTHNTYADSSPRNQTSKHMIGAEVDFYVQEMEGRTEEIVKLLQQYYKGKKGLEEFTRYENKDTDVSTLPWYNKEIFIKLYKKNEGRDLDNRHPYPYICIQVRFDTAKNEKVVYNWKDAQSCFHRY